jgi:predicted translin family RNA/ssDNA-binding protein
MFHKSQRDLFFEIAERIQIIYSPKVENTYRSLAKMIKELQQLAEMYEIWSDLENEADLANASRVQEILSQIYHYVGRKNDDRTLGIRVTVLVDEEVQNLLRNLDAMTVFMTLQETLFDGGREELKPLIRTILQKCNDLICLFVKNSEINQTIAFEYMDWFIDRIDDNINTAKVLKAVVEGNKGKIRLIFFLLFFSFLPSYLPSYLPSVLPSFLPSFLFIRID